MLGQLADKVDDLVSSIDELEDVLKPLLETPLSSLTTQLPAPLDRAKLQDRVKGYFAKIKEAENPAKRTLVVDGKVANRFIKHALASAISPANFESSSSVPKPTHTRFHEDGNSTRPSVPAEPSTKPQPNDESSSDSDAEPEAGTWKAKKRAREADLANQRKGGDEEPESEESLDGWEETNVTSAPAVEDAKPQHGLSSRTKRPRMDPFAGYSQPSSKPPKLAETTMKPASTSSTPAPQPAADVSQAVNDATHSSPASASTPPSAPGGRKTRRKTK
ncbi:hypothetical protein FRC10_012049, partial [Ceratobasidium sp. 414]